MRKFILSLAILAVTVASVSAQVYFTKSGHISFFSDAKLEKITANNYKVSSAIDFSTGNMEFSLNIKGFEFKKALMQEHFNAKEYMHSDVHPTSTFKGKIDNPQAVNLTKDGTYQVAVSGKLTIKGVTKDVSTNGTITVKGGKVASKAVFKIKLKDYGVVPPKSNVGKISETISITVDINNYEKK